MVRAVLYQSAQVRGPCGVDRRTDVDPAPAAFLPLSPPAHHLTCRPALLVDRRRKWTHLFPPLRLLGKGRRDDASLTNEHDVDLVRLFTNSCGSKELARTASHARGFSTRHARPSLHCSYFAVTFVYGRDHHEKLCRTARLPPSHRRALRIDRPRRALCWLSHWRPP